MLKCAPYFTRISHRWIVGTTQNTISGSIGIIIISYSICALEKFVQILSCILYKTLYFEDFGIIYLTYYLGGFWCNHKRAIIIINNLIIIFKKSCWELFKTIVGIYSCLKFNNNYYALKDDRYVTKSRTHLI